MNFFSSKEIRLEVITERRKHVLMPRDQSAEQNQNMRIGSSLPNNLKKKLAVSITNKLDL